jgi:hypothetical protein
MIYLCKLQSQPDYHYGKRVKSAFQWSGDVVAEEKPAQDLWGFEHDFSKVSRALFSRHIEEIYWIPAVDRMLVYVSSRPQDPALADVLSLEAAKYISETKGKSMQLYSSLSKGVHWEFLVSALVFDESTTKTLI